jgi:glycosyltransferase involved in cell wall biosynthesis
VEYAGRVSREDLAELYAGARFAVVPSIWPEPLGRAVLEAAFSGVPVVATRAGGISDAVEDGTTGLLVEPRDDAALAEAMVRLWQDPELAGTMGDAAGRLVRERFSPSHIARGAEEIYATALSRAG